MQRGRLRAAVLDSDLNEDVFRRRLGVFDEHVEVTVVIEHAGVEQLVFALVAAPAPIGLDEVGVGIGRLRILVEILHVGVGRRRVEVEVVFLYVLAVISLAVGQPEQPLLEDRVLAVPERKRKTEPLALVGNPRESVLAPAIGPRAGVVMTEVIPCIARIAVILAHGPPLPLAQVGAPFFPGSLLSSRLVKADLFAGHEDPPAWGSMR